LSSDRKIYFNATAALRANRGRKTYSFMAHALHLHQTIASTKIKHFSKFQDKFQKLFKSF